MTNEEIVEKYPGFAAETGAVEAEWVYSIEDVREMLAEARKQGFIDGKNKTISTIEEKTNFGAGYGLLNSIGDALKLAKELQP